MHSYVEEDFSLKHAQSVVLTIKSCNYQPVRRLLPIRSSVCDPHPFVLFSGWVCPGLFEGFYISKHSPLKRQQKRRPSCLTSSWQDLRVIRPASLPVHRTGYGDRFIAVPVWSSTLLLLWTRTARVHVVGRIRTCAGRPQWISSPSP